MIYVACPYAHPSVKVREARVHIASQYSGHLLRHGLGVFCPLSYSSGIIAHNRDIAKEVDWYTLDLAFLHSCSNVHVLMLWGYQDSKGVELETDYANIVGIPLSYISIGTLRGLGITGIEEAR